ncbi:MAG: nitroreductase family protein [Lachnospira eligens]
MELVETARLTPSAANRQPFKYRIVCDEEENEKVFRLLGFAGYLKDWDGPSEGEKPTGYIVITCPANVNDEVDAGIVGQTMLLAATEAGFGGCFFGNVKRDELKTQLNIPSELKIVYVIAFGYPKEEVVLRIFLRMEISSITEMRIRYIMCLRKELRILCYEGNDLKSHDTSC